MTRGRVWKPAPTGKATIGLDLAWIKNERENWVGGSNVPGQ
jgi:hypothetical protein